MDPWFAQCDTTVRSKSFELLVRVETKNAPNFGRLSLSTNMSRTGISSSLLPEEEFTCIYAVAGPWFLKKTKLTNNSS